jgi:uncharacterized protein YukE
VPAIEAAKIKIAIEVVKGTATAIAAGARLIREAREMIRRRGRDLGNDWQNEDHDAFMIKFEELNEDLNEMCACCEDYQKLLEVSCERYEARKSRTVRDAINLTRPLGR